MASAVFSNDYPTPPPSSLPQNKVGSYHGRPAQETYFQEAASYSRPASPAHWANQASSTYPNGQVVTQQQQQQPQYEYLPPRRSESPKLALAHSHVRPQSPQGQAYGGSNSNYYAQPASPLPQKTRPYQSPPRQRSNSPPKGRHSPRPLYYSPTNPVPSPYNASRPTPRPAFVQRMLKRIEGWIRSWFKWCKRNPITAGLATFLPVMAGVGLVRTANSLGIGKGLKNMFKRMGGGQATKGEGKKEWDWGMDQFAGFNCSKGGPLEGMLKIMQMGINHWCRLTSSNVPRLASIILELYFLEVKK